MHYPAYQNRSFFRTPSWRWDRVLTITSRWQTPGRASRHDDEFVRKARAFVLKFRDTQGDQNAQAQLWFTEPDLYYAYEFNQRLADMPDAAMFLQARLLAGQSFETIADAMGITVGTVKWYEALFFNVAEKLQHRDWITNQVLLPALMRAPAVGRDQFQASEIAKPFMDGSLKMFAYFGGTYMVDIMLTGFVPGSPVTAPDDLNSWFDRQWAVTVRRRSAQGAMGFELNKYNVTEVFAVHAKIVELDRAEDSGEVARTTTEKTIKSMLDSIPFAAGDDGGSPHRGTLLPRFDTMAAELRDEEMLEIAAGRTVPKIVNDWPKALPAPRDKPTQIVHADALDN